MKLQTSQKAFSLTLLLCAGGLGAALILQYRYGLHPCPLCVTQRIAILVIAALSVLGLVLPGKGRLAAAAFGVLASLAGFGVAAWHTAHVLFPPQEESCAPGLGYWLDHLWLTSKMPWLLSASGDCIKDAAGFLGVPLPTYAAVLFVLMTVGLRNAGRSSKPDIVEYSSAGKGARP